jgi:hypothetical protein
MKILLTPWTIFKFNNNMVDNTFVEEPSNNGVDVFMIIDFIIVSCCPCSIGK